MYKQTTPRAASYISVASVPLNSPFADTNINMAQKHTICAYKPPKQATNQRFQKKKRKDCKKSRNFAAHYACAHASRDRKR